MARYTLMIKARENDTTVAYHFGPDEQHLGLMEFDKVTWDFRELEPVPGPDAAAHLEQAFGKCYRLARTTGGFPDRTQYAA